ncbi:uncharacterized protein LOC127533323 [Acanthochromis polyacanthus]|uniref:uncharacterized protein LOC127533323 n=1 Tax=Acanthochromis polyacanthus TaxID=80966 RepID=UPI0022341B05|nr:uncharacterized protein LOC127533323 [Acanthochromis polyacanthus]
MHQCEDREEGVHSSKRFLCGEHENQSKAQSPEQQNTHFAGPGPGSRCVSMKSDQSKESPPNFRRSTDGRIQQQRPDSPEPSCLSFKSDQSKKDFIEFKDGHPSADQIVDQQTSEVPQSDQQNDLDSIFMVCT